MHTYCSLKLSAVCDKKTFREYLNKIIYVVLEVTNPEEMNYQAATYGHGVLTEGIKEGEYKNPEAIAYDDTTQYLFIADWKLSEYWCAPIQKNICTSLKRVSLLAPDCIYTTDYVSHAILKFFRHDYRLICWTGEYMVVRENINNPLQLSINPAKGWHYMSAILNDLLI